jgi:hypothetical protein
MMLRNMGPEGETLVVLTQSDYDALKAKVVLYDALRRNIRGCVPNTDDVINRIADSFIEQEREAATEPTNSEWAGGQDFFCWKCGGRTHREVGLCDECVPNHGTDTPALEAAVVPLAPGPCPKCGAPRRVTWVCAWEVWEGGQGPCLIADCEGCGFEERIRALDETAPSSPTEAFGVEP